MPLSVHASCHVVLPAPRRTRRIRNWEPGLNTGIAASLASSSASASNFSTYLRSAKRRARLLFAPARRRHRVPRHHLVPRRSVGEPRDRRAKLPPANSGGAPAECAATCSWPSRSTSSNGVPFRRSETSAAPSSSTSRATTSGRRHRPLGVRRSARRSPPGCCPLLLLS